MIHARCISTELLLERKAAALSHAERLRVETHLAECERCRREHAAMVSLLDAVEQKVASSVKSSVQERAIARAMLRSREQAAVDVPTRQLVPASGSPRWLVWGLAVAVSAALLAVGVWRRPWSAPGASSSSSSTPLGDRVIDGSLSNGGVRLPAGAAVPAHAELHPSGAFKVSLAHARLSVQGAESLVWSPENRVVALRGGVADVSVDPTLHQSFRVTTPRFAVDVMGTEFRVSADRVGVTRGRVRVLSPGGALWAELGAGQSWVYAAPVGSDAVAARDPATADSAQPTPAAAPSDARGAEPKSSASLLSATELLARARHRLADGDARAALSDLNAALAAGASRSQQAEAYTLKGDCALVQGDPRAAVRQYLEVSRRFSDLRAGETALFAAARTEANGGRQASAQKLLQAYRDRYPAGQFKREVEARLRILEAE